MELYFESKSLEISKLKVITGIISISFEKGVFFPEKNWNDNIVLVLNSWLENLYFLRRNIGVIEFNFYDGPFSFFIENKGNEVLLKIKNQNETYFLNKDNFENEVIRVSEKIMEVAKYKNWESNELKMLEKNILKAN